MRRRRALACAIGLAAIVAGCGDSSPDEGESSDPCAPENLIWVYARYLDRGPTYPTAVFRMQDGSETRLTDDDAATDASVSPDGSRIAFARGSEGDPESAGYTRHRLYVMGRDGSDEQPLLDPAYDIPADDADTAWDRFPVRSPDGSQVAFVRNADFDDPGENVHAVMVVPASGGEPQPMPGAGSDIWDPAPAWSADGSRLAWVTEESSSLRWSTIERPSSLDEVQLPGVTGAPAWIDDGQSIVVAYQRREYEPDAESGVYRVDLATGEYEKVPLDAWLEDLWAMPTGDVVGVETLRDDIGDGIGGRIVVLDPARPDDPTEIASFDTELNGLVTAVPDDPDGWAACTQM